MKKTIPIVLFTLILFQLFLIFVLPAEAAPAEWGIAINEDTNECAGYWAGDEYSYYSLPYGWNAYYPIYNEDWNGSIDTPFGVCNYISEESCCTELGLEYVSDNIGIDETWGNDFSEPIDGPYVPDPVPVGGPFMVAETLLWGCACCCCPTVFVIGLILLIVILTKKKK